MNLWATIAIAVGILAIAGVFVMGIGMVEADEVEETSSCTSCGKSCSAESNCGLASCGATKGGSCGCGG
jgi:hypothetical protein